MLTDKMEKKLKDKYRRKRLKQIEEIKKRIHPRIDYQTKNANIEQDIENLMR